MMNLRLLLFAFVAFLLSNSGCALAQAKAQPEFTCQIRLSPQPLVSDEPLRLDVKVQSLSDKPRKALLPLGPCQQD